MTELPPPSRHRRVAAQEPLPSNYVRKPNPVTGFIDRHKKLGIIVVVAAIALIIGIAAATGSTKKSPSTPSTPSHKMSVCEAVAEAPNLTRGDLIQAVRDSNPGMSIREAQDLVDASGCAPKP
jgi:hypothetical protein